MLSCCCGSPYASACMCWGVCMGRRGRWSSCCSCGFEAEPLLTCRHTTGQGNEDARKEARDRGPIPFCNSLYGHLSQKWPPRHPEISFLLRLWAIAAQLQRLSLTMFILRFTAGQKRKFRSEWCEQIRAWAYWKNIK